MDRKTIITAGGGVLLALGLASYAVAAREVGAVASYTGCLKNAKIESVAVGDAPAAPCGPGQTQVRLSGGDVTSVVAGTGLNGGGDGGELTLAVDRAAVQSRVTGSCGGTRLVPVDASISAINQDGSVTCNSDDAAAGADVIAGFYDGPVPIPVFQGEFEPVPIARLPLPAGKYAISGTVNVANLSEGFGDLAACALHAGSDFDQASANLGPFAHAGSSARLALQVVHEFGAPGVAEMRCGHLGFTTASWNFLKISATRAANLTNEPLELVSP